MKSLRLVKHNRATSTRVHCRVSGTTTEDGRRMADEARVQTPFPAAAVRHALTGTADGKPVEGPVTGPHSHPLADLRRLAVLWQKLNPAHGQGSGEADGSQMLPGPAGLAMAAAKLGLDVVCEQRDAGALASADMPVVVLLKDGSSRLAIGLQPNGRYRIVSAESEVDVLPSDLAAAASGTVFRIRPTPPEAQSIDVAATSAGASGKHSTASRTVRHHLLRLMRENGSSLRQLIIASLLINLFGMTLPLFSMAVFDRIIPHSAMETLWALALGVVAALVLEFCLRHTRLKLFDAVGQKTSHGLQGQAMGKLLHAPVSVLPGRSGAAVQPMQELEQLAMITPQLVVSLAVDVPFFVFLMVLIGSIGGPIVVAPIIGSLMLVLLHSLAHVMAHRSALAQGGFVRRLQQYAIDSLSAQERIRLTGSSPHMLAGWEQACDDAGYANHQARYWHGLAAQGSAVIIQLVVVATIVTGVFLIEAAAMTIGALSACILLVNRSMMPVSIATGMSFRMIQILQAAGPLASILEMKAESGGDESLAVPDRIAGHVSLQNISFRYPGETRIALNDVSFSIKPGEKIGIIGKAGCGKSTLLRLIARLYEPEQGRLQLDHRDIRQFDPAFVRRVISYMPQDAQLIDGTLDDNLTLGLSHVDKAEFERISTVCGVHAFATRNPSGYSLQVGPGGQRLSGGERQCVSLARALMGKPRVLMLDEPTAALDNMLEAKIIADLRSNLGDTGLIVATHRLPALDLVDRIIWIEDGRIAADGPKAEIFRKLGLATSGQAQKAANG
jgi:ATP-binding cassette, subfamily C, bacterial LapB